MQGAFANAPFIENLFSYQGSLHSNLPILFNASYYFGHSELVSESRWVAGKDWGILK